MLLNPLSLLTALFGRLLDRIAPQPTPLPGPSSGAKVLAFERRPRSPGLRVRAPGY